MPRISQLDPLNALSHLDLFEVTQRANNKSCSITAQEMANYFKTLSNGGFKGTTAKALNDFTMADVGVWYWTGDGGATGVSYGIVEIMGYASPDNSPADDKYIQKLTSGDRVYQRMFDNQWSNWAALTNRNGGIIEYGVSTATSITFPLNRFTDTPTIICQPVNDSTDYVYHVNVYSAGPTGFQVRKWKSCRASVKEITQETTTESGGTTTKTTTITVERGEWEVDDNASFFYLALSDVEN